VERKELLKAYQASKDVGTRTRSQAVRLYGEGNAVKEIEQIAGCSRTSLMEWNGVEPTEPINRKDWWITELVATVPN
jgi:hypothetical protein